MQLRTSLMAVIMSTVRLIGSQCVSWRLLEGEEKEGLSREEEVMEKKEKWRREKEGARDGVEEKKRRRRDGVEKKKRKRRDGVEKEKKEGWRREGGEGGTLDQIVSVTMCIDCAVRGHGLNLSFSVGADDLIYCP